MSELFSAPGSSLGSAGGSVVPTKDPLEYDKNNNKNPFLDSEIIDMDLLVDALKNLESWFTT